MDSEEKAEILADSLAISKLKLTGQVIISRANQQLKLEDDIRALNSDVSRVSRLGKARIDALDDMERRLRRMRHQLKTTTTPTVNDSVAADLYISNKSQVDAQFTVCTRCQRRILIKLMKAHDTACAKLKSKDTIYQGLRPVPKVDDEVQGLIDEYATFVPQPPRNIAVKEKGTSFIVWTWDPPVFEGGLPVLDYEISYNANIVEFDKSTGKYKRYIEACRSLLTTTCIRPMPVAHTGYPMIGLRAGTEYTEIVIRCRNEHGWSEWTPMVTKIEGGDQEQSKSNDISLNKNKSAVIVKRKKPGVMTDPAEPPSPPLFFVCTEITSGCIHLQWDVPFYDGGEPILEYRVSYTVLERKVSAMSRNVIVEKPNTIKVKTPRREESIPGHTTKLVIRNLPADTDVVDIQVKAINQADLIGQPCPLCGLMFPKDEEKEKEAKEKAAAEAQLSRMRSKRRGLKTKDDNGKEEDNEGGPGPRGIVCRTKVASRHRQLEWQLRQALEQEGDFIDTDFYTGITQRLLRKDFINQLKVDLLRTPSDPLEIEEERQWNSIHIAKAQKKAEEEAAKRRAEEEAERIDREEAARFAANDDLFEGDEDALVDDSMRFMFPFQQRRAHFKRRIADLEKKIVDLNNEKSEIDSERSRLTRYMQDRQISQVELRMERDRVLALSTDQVTSAILTGSLMTFIKDDFLVKISDAVEDAGHDIATAKYKVIEGAKRKMDIKEELQKAHERLQERQAAFMEFKKVYDKSQKIMESMRSAFSFLKPADGESVNGHSDTSSHRSLTSYVTLLNSVSPVDWEDLMSRSIASWLEYNKEKKHFKRTLEIYFHSFRLRFQRNAFAKWRFGKFLTDDDEESARKVIISLGGTLLQSAEEQREELQEDLRMLLTTANELKQKLTIAKLNKETRTTLLKSEEYRNMEEGMDLGTMSRKSQEIINKAYEAMKKGQAHGGKGKVKGLQNHGAGTILQFHNTPPADTAQLMKYFYEGDGYTMATRFEAAQRAYETQIMILRSYPKINVKFLSMCHGRMGRMYLAQGKFDRAIVDFDRQLSLAKEIDDDPEIAEANYGMGQGYVMRYDYDNALHYLDIAQARFVAVGNMGKHCEVLRLMQSCYRRTGREDVAKQYEEKLEVIEGSTDRKLKQIGNVIKDLHGRLMAGTSGVQPEFTVNIERTTLRAINLKNAIENSNDEIDECEEQLKSIREVVKRYQNIMTAIQKELDYANETDEIEMVSHMVHTTPQVVEVEEVKTRLAVRKITEQKNLDEVRKDERGVLTKIANAKEDIRTNEEELSIEEGSIMTKARYGKPFRLISFCRFNANGNEVTGTASEGVEWYLAAEGSNIHCIEYASGSLLHVCIGNDKHNLGAKVTGHSGLVTALLHDGKTLYSGGTDEWVLSWDADTKQVTKVFRGHEGSITALAANHIHLASAAADNTIRIWDKVKGEQLRVLHGHSKSVMSMEMGVDWLVSGGNDEEVRVWEFGKYGKYSLGVQCVHRLAGQEAPISCVRYGKLEVMAGDVLGRIFMWWIHTKGSQKPYVLYKIQVHTGPVKCLQFDAVYIVSGGADGTLCVTDIATGEVMQTIRAHAGGNDGLPEEEEEDDDDDDAKSPSKSDKKRKNRKKDPYAEAAEEKEKEKNGKGEKEGKDGEESTSGKSKSTKHLQKLGPERKQVLAVAFDSNRIISAGTDNTLRYWAWGKAEGLQDKYHILDKGQNLAAVSKMYNVPIEDLLKWNGVAEPRQVFVGMRIIVRKGDPDKPTAAEQAAEERERRRQAGLMMTASKKGKILGVDENSRLNKTRVERNVTDHEKVSMGNRMFGTEKKQAELFPDKADSYVNPHNITARIANSTSAGESALDRGTEGYFDYQLTLDNEKEWGEVADGLMIGMMNIFVEYEAYEVAREGLIEVKAADMDAKRTVHGRMFNFNKKIQMEVEAARAKEQAEKEEAERQIREKEERERLKREKAERERIAFMESRLQIQNEAQERVDMAREMELSESIRHLETWK